MLLLSCEQCHSPIPKDAEVCAQCGAVVPRPLKFARLTGRGWIVVAAAALLLAYWLFWKALFGDASGLLFGPNDVGRTLQVEGDLNNCLKKARDEAGGDSGKEQQLFQECVLAANEARSAADWRYRAWQAALCSTLPFLAALVAAAIARYLLSAGADKKRVTPGQVGSAGSKTGYQ